MKAIINSDHNVTVSESSISELSSLVESGLERFASSLTRVEVHLSDGSAGRKTGDDIRCLIEARPAGRNPESASENASTPEAALSGALRKMVSVLDTMFGRLDQRKGSISMGGPTPPEEG